MRLNDARSQKGSETPRVGRGIAAGQGASSGWVCVDKTRAPVAVPGLVLKGSQQPLYRRAEIKRLSNR